MSSCLKLLPCHRRALIPRCKLNSVILVITRSKSKSGTSTVNYASPSTSFSNDSLSDSILSAMANNTVSNSITPQKFTEPQRVEFPRVPVTSKLSKQAVAKLANDFMLVVSISVLMKTDSNYMKPYNVLLEDSQTHIDLLNSQYNSSKIPKTNRLSFHEYVGYFLVHNETECFEFFQKQIISSVENIAHGKVQPFSDMCTWTQKLFDTSHTYDKYSNAKINYWMLSPDSKMNSTHSPLQLPPFTNPQSYALPVFFLRASQSSFKGSHIVAFKLKALIKYGHLVSRFYFKLNMLKYHGPDIDELNVLNVIAPKSIEVSKLIDCFDKSSIDTGSPQKLFFKYMALSYQANPHIITEWIATLVRSGAWKPRSSHSPHLDHSNLLKPARALSGVNLRPLKVSARHASVFIDNEAMQEELYHLGRKLVGLVIWEQLVTTIPEYHQSFDDLSSQCLHIIRNHLKTLFSHAGDRIPTEYSHLEPLSLLALYSLQSLDATKDLIRALFVENASDFKKTSNYLRDEISQANIPTLKLSKASKTDMNSILSLPAFEDTSNMSSILMANTIVENNTSSNLKRAVKHFSRLGTWVYNFNVMYWVMRSIDVHTVEYYEPLAKFFNSTTFKRSVLDSNSIFENAFTDKAYQDSLVTKRHDPALVPTQFAQYLTTLIVSQSQSVNVVHNWTRKVVKGVTGEVLQLPPNEISQFFKTFVKSGEFSLRRKFAQNVVEAFQRSSTSFQFPLLKQQDTHLSQDTQQRLDQVGYNFVSYASSKYFLGHAGSLDTYIEEKSELHYILSRLFYECPHLAKSSSYKTYFGSLVVEKGIDSAYSVVTELWDVILDRQTVDTGFLNDTVPLNIAINESICQSGYELSLPPLSASRLDPRSSRVIRLALLNYYVSAEYLESLGVHTNPVLYFPSTKLNSIGRHYYRTSVLRTIEASKEKLTPAAVASLEDLLLSGTFVSSVALKSEIIFDPFKDAKYTRIMLDSIRTRHTLVKTCSQGFYQYFGALAVLDVKSADSWIARMAANFTTEIAECDSVLAQQALVTRLAQDCVDDLTNVLSAIKGTRR